MPVTPGRKRVALAGEQPIPAGIRCEIRHWRDCPCDAFGSVNGDPLDGLGRRHEQNGRGYVESHRKAVKVVDSDRRVPPPSLLDLLAGRPPGGRSQAAVTESPKPLESGEGSRDGRPERRDGGAGLHLRDGTD